MIKDNNFMVISGWMLNKLHLKGLELMVYAVIYGFCQQPGHYFSGSIQYLQDWTGASKNGVLRALKNLCEAGLLIKEESWPTNRYTVSELEDNTSNSTQSRQQSDNGTLNGLNGTLSVPISTPSVHNNIDINIDNNIDRIPASGSSQELANKGRVDSFSKAKEELAAIHTIVGYLNKTCGTSYRSSSSFTQRIIRRRLKEGYTIDDFKKVIDNKFEDWGRNPVKFNNGTMSSSYLRPATLFADDKFETYLNTPVHVSQSPKRLTESKKLSDSISGPTETQKLEYCPEFAF